MFFRFKVFLFLKLADSFYCFIFFFLMELVTPSEMMRLRPKCCLSVAVVKAAQMSLHKATKLIDVKSVIG